MKKFIIQALALLMVTFLSLAIATGKIGPNFSLIPQQNKNTQVIINGFKIAVELADTQSKRSQGLGGRDKLASNSGMLFIFPEAKKYSFWMKGLKFPLDIIWIRQKQVVDIIKNAMPPEPSQSEESLPIYQPHQEVDMVLEVNGGFVDSHSIKVGNIIEVK